MKKSQDSESVSVCSAAATNGPQRKRGFSLRRLLVASHLIGHRPARSHSAKQQKNTSTLKDADTKSTGVGSSSKDAERGSASELHKATSRTSVFTTSTKSSAEASALVECPLCLEEVTSYALAELAACGHRSCYTCLSVYLRIEISESRVQIACPECAEPMHPNEIRAILDDAALYEKYEDFMVRRVLAVDPDTRWCPAPDCGYAVIASGCASCPKIKCQRPGCLAHFCYHCKAEWHPNQTCDAARAQRSPNVRSSSVSFSQDSAHRDDIKPCPRCAVLIVKMDDGSCNHMMCAVCGAEFCWLCMKEISDLHYLSPSGCTFWGKKPWSRKKKILWQLGTLVGAPVGIALVAGIAVPAMIIGIPVWVGRKLYTRYRLANKHKRNAAIVGGAIASVLISPVLAGLAVGIGVPILLFYVYGVVPVSLCRSGGCGVSTSSGGVKFEFDDELSQTSASVRHADNLDSRETASNVAVAGSIGSGSAMSTAVQRLEVQAEVASAQRFSMSSETASQSASLSEKSVNVSIADDGGASTRALAGSVLNCKAATSDTCSCIAEPDDCSSERVRFDDNISFIAPYPDKVSIGSSCSFRTRCGKTSSASVTKSPLHVADNSDSISIDMSSGQVDSPGDKKRSATEILRSVFFRSTIDDGIEIQKPLPVIEEPMPPPPLSVEEATEA